jgi:hypothetical protein
VASRVPLALVPDAALDSAGAAPPADAAVEAGAQAASPEVDAGALLPNDAGLSGPTTFWPAPRPLAGDAGVPLRLPPTGVGQRPAGGGLPSRFPPPRLPASGLGPRDLVPR